MGGMAKRAVGEEAAVGPRLRACRCERNLSLRALAERADVTASALSLIETQKTSPSVATLKRILTALNLTLRDFFAAGPAPDDDPGFVIARGRLIDVGTGSGVRFLTLPGRHTDRALQVMREVYEPGADTGAEGYVHAGEEAGFCVSGRIEVTVGGRSAVLRPGDAYYFQSSVPHRWRNVGPGRAVLFSACTPPTF